jgi:predicted GIY-YIG superfamily endonuclease
MSEKEIYTVYVLSSAVDGSYYKGMTQNIGSRLEQHNAGKTKSTKSKRPWQVIYTEKYATAAEARAREKYFKTAAGRRYLKAKLG